MYIIYYISQNNGILTMLIKGGRKTRNIARSCVVISYSSQQELPPLHVLVLFNLIGRFLWLMIPTYLNHRLMAHRPIIKLFHAHEIKRTKTTIIIYYQNIFICDIIYRINDSCKVTSVQLVMPYSPLYIAACK